MTAWSVRVTDCLLEQRQMGVYDFEKAWRAAIRAVPPRRMDYGPAVRELTDEVSLVEFVYQACREEWHGRVIADFRADLQAALSSESELWARHARSTRPMLG